MFEKKNAEEIAAMSPEEQNKYFEAKSKDEADKLEALKLELKENASDEITAKITSLKAEIFESNKALEIALEKQGLAMTKAFATNKVATAKTIVDVVEENKDSIISIVKDGVSKEVVIKADTVRASVTNAKEYYAVPDIGQLATRKLTLYDLFAKIPVGSGSGGNVAYYDWDEDTTVRAAAAIAENGVFPSSTAKWAWYSLPLIKVGDTLPVSEEFDKDMPRFAAELSQFLKTNVDLVVDTQLYSGSGSGVNMKGLYTSADTFTPTAQGMTDASIYDLVAYTKANITATTGGKYMPNFALMNSVDILKYKLKKDSNNNYIMPPFVSPDGKVIDGITIIETAAVTANTMVLGDNRYAKIYEVDGYSLVKGLADGDFMSDMFTLKARRRMMLLVKNADAAGFNKITSISAALTLLDT